MGQALWTTEWSRKNPLGERTIIETTTPAKMQAIKQRYYVPNNTAVIVTGDVAPDRAFNLARSVFGGWARGPDPFAAEAIPDPPPLPKDTAVIVEQPIGSIVVMFQWQGPSATKDQPATYAADVFSDVLNQPDSRFQRRLVDSGLFESITVNYYTLNHVGPITIAGETSPEHFSEAIKALRDEIGKLGDTTYFSDDNLAAIKRRRIVGTELGLERASGFAHQLGFWWAVTGLDYFYGYVDTMAKQRRSDLTAYANKYIVGRPRVVGVLLSPDNRRVLGLTSRTLLGTGPQP